MIFLHNTVTFVFSNPAIYADSASAANTESSLGTGFGLPCAVIIMGFLCQKLHQRNDSSSSNSDAAVSSTGSTIRQREVLLSFNLLECALVACDAELITGVPSLMFFIKDDLCKAVLRYCRLGCVLHSAFSYADLILTHTCDGVQRLHGAEYFYRLSENYQTVMVKASVRDQNANRGSF